MKKLNFELKENYKSFIMGFNHQLLGDLIVISGVNGSGKSQLLDILKGYRTQKLEEKIQRGISQNDITLKEDEIIYKSFKDFATIHELTQSSIVNTSRIKTEMYQWYKKHRFDVQRIPPSDRTSRNFSDIQPKLRSLLLEHFSQNKFDRGEITEDEFKRALPDQFVLYGDDIFSNKIGEIFFNYVSMVYNQQADAGKTGTKFDSSTLPPAPWAVLNALFDKLRLGYRFKNNYERINDEINEQPALYCIDKNNKLIESEKRFLNDLSDGEKNLISLTFAVLASEQMHPKLLLLDEYDAPLNPSLIESLFVILKDFFLDKGIQVILTTHSPATISLAPEYCSFYEMYNLPRNNMRILEVNRDQYVELKTANRRFYQKIEDQSLRFEEIKKENESLSKIIEKIKSDSLNKLQIVTEGNNIHYIKKTIEIISPELIEKIEFVSGALDHTSKEQLKQAYHIVCNFPNIGKTLFVWDCDAQNIVAPLTETPICGKFCFDRNVENSLCDSGLENSFDEKLFTEDLFRIDHKKKAGATTVTTKTLDKNKFLDKILTLTEKKYFRNYEPLIAKIEDFLLPKIV